MRPSSFSCSFDQKKKESLSCGIAPHVSVSDGAIVEMHRGWPALDPSFDAKSSIRRSKNVDSSALNWE